MANLKIPGSFSEKYIPNRSTTPPPCLFFFWNSPLFVDSLIDCYYLLQTAYFPEKFPKVKILFPKVFSRLAIDNLNVFIAKILKMSYLIQGYTRHLHFLFHMIHLGAGSLRQGCVTSVHVVAARSCYLGTILFRLW